MSGYQRLPDQNGYNSAYPQYGQPAYGAPPAYAPAYAAQPAPAYQSGYPPQYPAQPPASGPIVVNVTNNQQQHQEQRPVVVSNTVFLGRSYDSDVGPALIIFIVGWFCCFVWAAGFKYIRSRNTVARILGIVSVLLFFGAIASIITIIAVSVSAANAVIHNSQSYTTTITVNGNSNLGTASLFMSSTYSYATISYSSGSWSTNGNGQTYANGYSSYSCQSASCPNQFAPLMQLEARCNAFGTWSPATTSNFYCSGETMYLAPNLPTGQSGSGSLTVSITFWV